MSPKVFFVLPDCSGVKLSSQSPIGSPLSQKTEAIRRQAIEINSASLTPMSCPMEVNLTIRRKLDVPRLYHKSFQTTRSGPDC